jgi:hypothetical protein
MIRCVKQYGEKRTGTNYVRALVLADYPDVIPLMHVLGDKHSPPVDFDHFLQCAGAAPDPDTEFVRAATLATPAESTRLADPEQMAYLQNIARSVAASVREGTLGFAISCKHPCSWAASMARYSNWVVWYPDGPRMHPLCAGALAAACRDYNRKYRAWLDLYHRFESRCVLIRHEDLVEDTPAVLRKMEVHLGLPRAQPELTVVTRGVLPADWDQSETRLHPGEFDSAFYRGNDYLRELSPDLWRMVEETIDWSIAAELGYERLS